MVWLGPPGFIAAYLQRKYPRQNAVLMSAIILGVFFAWLFIIAELGYLWEKYK